MARPIARRALIDSTLDYGTILRLLLCQTVQMFLKNSVPPTLLAMDASPAAVQAFRDAATASNIPLTVVAAPMNDELARYHASLVLVRPDAFVAGAGSSAEAVEAAEYVTKTVRRIANV